LLFFLYFCYYNFNNKNMALSVVDYNSIIDYKLATKQIRFTDTTDYVSQGISTSDVTVVFKVEDPSGTIYNNTNHSAPDIDPDVSLDSVIVIPLTIDIATGLPLQGAYTITAEYEETSGVPYTVTKVKTFTLDYASPTADLDMTVDYNQPLLSSIDSTNYTSGGINPTISRTHLIHYPLASGAADVSGTAATLSTNTFYVTSGETVEHSCSIVSDLSYDFTGGFLLVDEITGNHIEHIADGGNLYNVFCYIEQQYNRFLAAKNSNSTKRAYEWQVFVDITSLAEAVEMATKFGENDKTAKYILEIEEIASANGLCCEEGTLQLVTGTGGGVGGLVVVASGTGISVALSSGGGTDTYTVNLSSVNINKLAATYNTVLAAGANISSLSTAVVTVADVTTKTTTINATNTYVDTEFVRVTISPVSGVQPSIAITNQKQLGSVFKAVNQTASTEFMLNNNGTVLADWQNKLTDFTIGNFFAAGAVDYYPSVELVKFTPNSLGNNLSWTTLIYPEIVNVGTSTMTFRFVDQGGNPVNGNFIDTINTIELIFKIQA